jgi:hypothetical protein
MHALIRIAVYLAVTLTPLVLSALQGRAIRPFWAEISSGLAMTAFAFVLVEFVLSARFKVMSARIGMDVTMRMHQLTLGLHFGSLASGLIAWITLRALCTATTAVSL